MNRLIMTFLSLSAALLSSAAFAQIDEEVLFLDPFVVSDTRVDDFLCMLGGQEEEPPYVFIGLFGPEGEDGGGGGGGGAPLMVQQWTGTLGQQGPDCFGLSATMNPFDYRASPGGLTGQTYWIDMPTSTPGVYVQIIHYNLVLQDGNTVKFAFTEAVKVGPPSDIELGSSQLDTNAVSINEDYGLKIPGGVHQGKKVIGFTVTVNATFVKNQDIPAGYNATPSTTHSGENIHEAPENGVTTRIGKFSSKDGADFDFFSQGQQQTVRSIVGDSRGVFVHPPRKTSTNDGC